MHVDLVRNDWSRREQTWLGFVVAVDDQLMAKDIADDYVELVNDAIHRVNTLQPIEDRLCQLAELVSGSHVFMTDAHVDADCPFRFGHVLEMTSEPFVGLPG